MITSIVSNSSYSLAAYSLKNNSAAREQAVAKIASGSTSGAGLNGGQVDSLSLRVRTTVASDSKIVSNLGNALSFLDAQANSLNHIASLVSAMGEVASKMQDVTKKKDDLENYMKEFNALRLQMTAEVNSSYGDQSLHSYQYGAPSSFKVSLNNEGTQSVTFSQSDFLSNGRDGWATLIGDANAIKGATGAEAQSLLENADAPPPPPAEDDFMTGGTPQSIVPKPVITPVVTPNSKTAEGAGTEGFTQTPQDILDPNKWGVASFDALYSGVASMIADNYIQQGALRAGLDSVTSRSASMTALGNQITGSDVAHEVASLAKTQLMNQSASSALAQTNLSAQGVIKALWGEPSSGIDWFKPEITRSILPKISFT
jgi:flagellin-like hook-associated protein FlgL